MTKKLRLESLANGIPVIHEDMVGYYKHSCMVCFHTQGYTSGVKFKVVREEMADTYYQVCWTGEVTNELMRQYAGTSRKLNDYAPTTRTIDDAACAIALLLVRELTEYTAISKARIGTTVDYYLISKKQNIDLLFNEAEARLEVSGILAETKNNTVMARVKEKRERLAPEDMPTFIVIVEFSNPYAKVVKE
jgi:hypothetical protein